jgi:hypothetical protein
MKDFLHARNCLPERKLQTPAMRISWHIPEGIGSRMEPEVLMAHSY